MPNAAAHLTMATNSAAKQQDTMEDPGDVASVPRVGAANRPPESQPSARRELLGVVKQLEQRRDEIMDRARNTRDQLDQQVPDGPGDVGDISVLDTSADFFLNMAGQQRAELQQIADALDRL